MLPPHTIPVRFAPGAPRAYDVVIGAGLLCELGARVRDASPARPTRCLLVVDSGLTAATTEVAIASLRAANLPPVIVPFRASEGGKSWEAAGALAEAMAAEGIERSDPVIALGGGVVGDIAGFAAAVYRRGVPLIQCPTTLLSMVDASVGGKTGVNLPGPDGLLKNMAGAFHQPTLVLADTATLSTLPERHFRAGLAEAVKHALISRCVSRPDDPLPEWTAATLPAILTREPAVLAELIARSVSLKAGVVEGDERELLPSAGRALLNLGHTFGHALETLPELDLLHGEAVALGLIAASACSAHAGRCSSDLPDAVRDLVRAAQLPLRLAQRADPARVLARMRHDKKSVSGSLRLILPTALGRAEVVSGVSETSIHAGLSAIALP